MVIYGKRGKGRTKITYHGKIWEFGGIQRFIYLYWLAHDRKASKAMASQFNELPNY